MIIQYLAANIQMKNNYVVVSTIRGPLPPLDVDHHVLVESGLLDLCSCATPVVPELKGKDIRKTPR
jgi:hypothetical protein